MATGRGEVVSEVRRTAQGCAGLMSTFRAEGGEPTAMDKERMYVVLARLVVWQYPEVASRPALNCHCRQHVILGHERVAPHIFKMRFSLTLVSRLTPP